MRILHVFDGYGTPGERALAGEGSVPSAVYYIAKYAAERHDVTILERDNGCLPREELAGGIRYFRIRADKLPAPPYRLIKSPRGLAALALDSVNVARKIGEFLKEEDFDIIHFHFPFASSILVSTRRGLGEKSIYTAHVGEESKRFGLDPSAPLLLRLFSPDIYLMKRVARGVVLNYDLKEKLIARGIPPGKLEVIPNGVNVEEFPASEEDAESARAKYGLSGVVVMFAGTVTPRKGVEYLIRAAELLRDMRELMFLIAGRLDLDREYAERVVKYARERGVNAKFAGFVPYEDLKALYAACDIFVLPSLEEGSPIALLEAMASGKPLIGSRVGGIKMQIRDGWNGFLVEPGDVVQLAERIRYLAENEGERKRMGANSRKLAEEEFDWRKIAEKYLKVYEEIAG